MKKTLFINLLIFLALVSLASAGTYIHAGNVRNCYNATPTIFDDIGSRNEDASKQGVPAYFETSPFTQGSGYYFDGVASNYFNVTKLINFTEERDGVCVIVWAMINDSSSSRYLFNINPATTNSMLIGAFIDGNMDYSVNDVAQADVFAYPLKSLEMYGLSTNASNTMTSWRNDSLVGSQAHTEFTDKKASNLEIAFLAGYPRSLIGYISQFIVINQTGGCNQDIMTEAFIDREACDVILTPPPPGDVAPNPPSFVDPTPANATRDTTNRTINMSCDETLNYYLWFDDSNPPQSIVLENTTFGNWTMNATTDQAYFYTGACVNITSSLFSTNTTLRNYTLDTTTPTITINPNTFFNATTNQSTIDQYSDVLLPINITFEDPDGDLFGFLLNITKGGVIFFNITNTSLFGTSYNYTKELNTSTWEAGIYDINIEVADRHTLSNIGGYDISQFGNKITFRTAERNTIKISSIGAYTTTYQKSRDRYAFGFKYIFSGEARTFTLESDKKIYYLQDSKYNAHFVVLGDKLRGNWIDFGGIGSYYDVEKISDYEYKIMFNNLEKSNEVTLNSIGGLNTRIENYQWYKGTTTTTFSSSATTESSQEFTLNVTIQSGFIDSINATFEYNNSFRAISTTREPQSMFFSSEFTVPIPEETYNFTWNITVTQNDSSLYDFNISGSQDVLLAQINISFFDEENQSSITENVTVFLTLEQTTQAASDEGFVLIGNLTLGEYFIEGESSSYPRRGIFFTVTNQTQKINLYLLVDRTGNELTDYFIKSTSQVNVENARMTFQKSINSSFITVAQAESDFAGQVRQFQDQSTEYRIVITHDVFPTKILSLRPLLSEYTIFLDEVLESLYKNVWEGIRYTLFPKERLHNVSLTPLAVGIDILSDDSSLEYFGVFIDDHNFTCVPASCVSNITGIPAGGTTQVTILGNVTGTFDVHYFFKKSGFELQYVHGDLYGFIIIAELFGENLANWLDNLANGLGGKDAAKPMLSILAAVLTTVLVVIASQLGIIGVPLVLVAVFGNFFFMIAGFIPDFIAIVSAIVGITFYILLGRIE